MNKPYVTIKSTVFSFLLFCILLALCIAVMYDQDQKRKFLYIPLIVGLLICLLNSYNNIIKKLTIIDTELRKTNAPTNKNHAELITCPEYWKRQVVYKDGNKNDPYTMCYNKFKSTEHDVNFIGGKLTNTEDGVNTDFVFQHGSNVVVDKDPEKRLSHNWAQDSQSNLLYEQGVVQVDQIDNFVDGNGSLIEGFDDPEVYHRHYVNTQTSGKMDINPYSEKRVTIDGTTVIGGDSNNIPSGFNTDHNHEFTHNYRYSHSHGGAGDININNNPFPIYGGELANSNLDYWFSPFNDGVNNLAEINLTQLNKIENNCQLTKPFNWVEAKNKCVTSTFKN